MAISSASSRLLSRYVIKEFSKTFLGAFFFFFAIFFVNTILLLVQKILLKNISVPVMIEMVLLYMPQFLVYTFPFATLTASSMVLGDMAASNELLAIKSLGLSNRRIYTPIIIVSIILSVATFLTADLLQPYTSVIYRDKLALLMAEMPTLEIEPNSINSVGNIILSNGKAEGNSIEDILLISKEENGYNKTVKSYRGEMNIIDPINFVYTFDLFSPSILMTDAKGKDTFAYADAKEGRFYLDFSSQVPSLTNTSPVNKSSKDLIASIKERNSIQKRDREDWWKEKESNYMKLSNELIKLEKGSNDYSNTNDLIEEVNENDTPSSDLPVNFYGQYYKSELTKKIALSLACFVLTLVTLPLSNVRVKHGKLTGFAVAILIAVLYWYMLFGCQLLIFDIVSSPYLLILLPDLLILFVALILLYVFRKAR